MQWMTTRGSYVHKPMLTFSGASQIFFFFCNFSKYWWFQTKRFTRLLEFIKLYKQNPVEKFFIFRSVYDTVGSFNSTLKAPDSVVREKCHGTHRIAMQPCSHCAIFQIFGPVWVSYSELLDMRIGVQGVQGGGGGKGGAGSPPPPQNFSNSHFRAKKIM